MLCSLEEGELLTGQSDPHAIAAALRERGPQQTIVKTGTAGAHYFGEGREEFVPAFPIPREVDPIGAGDGFATGFLAATLEGREPCEALQRRHTVGAMVCLADGHWEGLPRRHELESFLSRQTGSERQPPLFEP